MGPPPPVLIPPASSRPPRKGRGWMILALILLVLLGFSMLMNFSHFVTSAFRVSGGSYNASGPRLEEVVLEEHGGGDKLAVVRIEGIITGQMIDQSGFSMVDVIKAQFERAADDHRVKAVLLKVDSPGGEVLAADDIARAIEEFQSATNGKPVIVSMGSLAASGGYYVSAPCRWIVANELTITGSIGVIMSTWNYRGLMDKVGVRPFTFKSGRFKDMLSGSRKPDDITEEERDMVQKLINETYGRFTGVVMDGRTKAFNVNAKGKRKGRMLVDNWRDYADGRILSGKEAHALGFVDALGNFDDAVDEAAGIAGVRKFDLVEYRLHYDLADLFRLFGKSDVKGVKIDLGVEVPKLLPGRLYFLPTTELY